MLCSFDNDLTFHDAYMHAPGVDTHERNARFFTYYIDILALFGTAVHHLAKQYKLKFSKAWCTLQHTSEHFFTTPRESPSISFPGEGPDSATT